MVNGARRWQNMAEMFMTRPDGSEIIFEQDGSISVPGLLAFCDRCEKTQPEKSGKVITDATGQVIMWFCFQCRLQAYIK